MPGAHVLVVDDHIEMARLLADQLGDHGYTVDIADGGAVALTQVRARLPDLVITDLRMEKVDGFDVLDGVRALDPELPVLIMTAYGGVENAVEAIKRGAAHYITKPFRLDEVLLYVERCLDERRLRTENRVLKRAAAAVPGAGTWARMVGRSEPMRRLFELTERVAQSQAPVLVRGESGVGKELVARALHEQGPRRSAPFVAVNCTALPESLLESELFGHVKGAYTGATASRRGLFVEADGGTLFLDEIGDMALPLQARLLRVLEDGEVRAVGSDSARRVDVRVVAATHQDLDQRVKDAAFRQDLYYRLDVVQLVVPPLRDRPEDIPLLAEHFLRRAVDKNPWSRVRRFSAEVLSALASASFAGNVRELENIIERLVIVVAADELSLADLSTHAPALLVAPSPVAAFKQRLMPLRQLEAEYIAWVVAECGGNKTRAAEILGIDVSTIHRRERDR